MSKIVDDTDDDANDTAHAHARLRDLAKQLPYERPDAERRESLRSSLLVAASQPAPANKRWFLVGGGFAAGVLAAAAIAVVVIGPRSSSPARIDAQARIEAPPTAKLEHTIATTAAGTDELVRVHAGVVRLAVPAVKRGDRVRMQTADAEVEGTGSYEVAVVDDKLERVTVTEGTARVAVRVDGKQQQVFLAAGESWRPTIVTADIDLPVIASSVEPAKPAVESKVGSANAIVTSKVAPANPAVAASTEPPPVSKAEPTKPSVTSKVELGASNPAPRMPAVTAIEQSPTPMPSTKRQTSQTEQHFSRGWALLRDGKAAEAAVELGAAADADPSDPLASDARYFQAVALVRAGQGRDAEQMLVAFLDHAPTSLRRGRAAILLGKLLRDRGDAKSARAWFESALGDDDPAIAAAAKAHLDALSPRR